jgi:hypothetical protein
MDTTTNTDAALALIATLGDLPRALTECRAGGQRLPISEGARRAMAAQGVDADLAACEILVELAFVRDVPGYARTSGGARINAIHARPLFVELAARS